MFIRDLFSAYTMVIVYYRLHANNKNFIIIEASHPLMASPYGVTNFFSPLFSSATENDIPGGRDSEGNLALAWYFPGGILGKPS